METIQQTEVFEIPQGRGKQRALDTFLRNSYRTHTSMGALADRKANIMIRFNSILISILIVFFNNIMEINPAALYSGIAFMISALGSLIFATLSARPNATKLYDKKVPWTTVKDNIFFYGNFINLSKQDYMKAFNLMMQDKKTIYGNMARDLYHLGKILEKKFKFLMWSYNIFLVGLIFTVLAFLFSFFVIAPSG